MSDLSGRTALVTGAAHGIGAAIAKRFHEAGARLILVDVAGEGLATVAAMLGGGSEVSTCVQDVRNGGQIAAWLDERELVPDVLVNNAAIAPSANAVDVTPSFLSEVMSVNFEAPVHLAREVGGRLIDSGRAGSIVNVSSVNAYLGIPAMLAYNASKAALLSASRTLAIEWAAHGIRVNAVCPGTTATHIWRQGNWTAEDQAAFAAKNAFGRMADPAEIAAAVHFLASDDASFVTAHELVADAGVMAML